MNCKAYNVYTFHLSLHHANFGQFKKKQVKLQVPAGDGEGKHKLKMYVHLKTYIFIKKTVFLKNWQKLA